MAETPADEIRQARSEYQLTREAYIESASRLAALEAAAAVRLAFQPVQGSLRGLTRNEAVLAVVRGAGGPIRLREVAAELRSRGFPSVEDKAVNVTLGRLEKARTIERVGRGIYIAL